MSGLDCLRAVWSALSLNQQIRVVLWIVMTCWG